MNLAFTTSIANDSSSITVTDTTPDWEAGGIQGVYDNGYAELYITIGESAYDGIDVSSYFDGGQQAALVFEILPEDLSLNGESPGIIPDGDWIIEYYAGHDIGGGQDDDVVDTGYNYLLAEKGVADELQVANLNDWKFDNTLHEAILVGSWSTYLQAIQQAASEDELTDFRTGLENLQIMLANRSY